METDVVKLVLSQAEFADLHRIILDAGMCPEEGMPGRGGWITELMRKIRERFPHIKPFTTYRVKVDYKK